MLLPEMNHPNRPNMPRSRWSLALTSLTMVAFISAIDLLLSVRRQSPFTMPLSGPNHDLSNWMSHYPPDISLSSLSLPGSHDAATWSYHGPQSPSIRTQNCSIRTSLNDGIRFFDLRYALAPAGTDLVFYHHSALLLNGTSVAAGLSVFYAWLSLHKTETVLVSLMYEGGTLPGADDNEVVQRLLFDTLTCPDAREYILQTRDELGTLGNARGKAVLVRRFELDRLPASYEQALPGIRLGPSLWAENSPAFDVVYNTDLDLTAHVEDYYEPEVPPGATLGVVVGTKMEAVKRHLEKAIGRREEDELFITFVSGRKLDDELPVYPETLALGERNVVGANRLLGKWLKERREEREREERLRLGIVVLDFWDEPGELVRVILGL